MTYSNALIALAASYNGTSYSLPSYVVYPYDNFFGKIQSIPYNISNVQTSTLAAVAQRAKTYSPNVYAYAGISDGIISTPTTRVLYSETSIGFSSPGSQAVKSNPVTDPHNGDVYWTYTVDNFLPITTTDTSGYLHMFSIDLNTTPGYYTVDIAEAVTDYCDISGALVINGYIAYGATIVTPYGTNLVTIVDGIDYDTDVALTTFSTTTELDYLTAGGVQYLISGNRLWLAVSSSSSVQLSNQVHVALTFQVIERRNPSSLSELSAAVLASALA